MQIRSICEWALHYAYLSSLTKSFSLIGSDIWDHMFLSSCCRSLTMHQFDAPPSVILDLGCGSGYWAMEAAKLWTVRSFVRLLVLPVSTDVQVSG